MNSECVDLIATDPPFNKGRDFHATPESLADGASFQDRWSWEKDVQEAWCDRIKDCQPSLMGAIQSARYAHSDGMGAFMCFLSVRLLEMRRVLKPTGSIYLHCDPTASHYIKACMDSIFGAKNFRNEVVWCYSGGGTPRTDFPRKHDIILRYTKTNKWVFNREFKSYSDITAKHGRHSFTSGGEELDLERGTPITDWWNDITIITSWGKERVGYPTQKPLQLYRRIIKASSNKGDVVLDPFCGCATTLIAAEALERKWVGMDLWKNAVKVIKDRLVQEGLAIKGEAPPQGKSKSLFAEDIAFLKEPPVRTDDKKKAVLPFKTQER